MSLRVRLALITSLLTFAGLALGSGITYQLLERTRLADLDRELRLKAELILDAAKENPKHQVSTEIEDQLIEETGASVAQVFEGQQMVWQGGVYSPAGALNLSAIHSRGSSTAGGWRVFTATDGALSSQVGQPLAALQATLQRYVEVTVPLVALLVVLSGVAGFVVAGLAVRPLEKLTRAARHFEEGAQVPKIEGRDEAASLAEAFAGLLDRLNSERLREQRFLAYAAHELRTPLSAFRASLEAARLQGTLDSEKLSRLHRESLRMETLAQNLLALSRAEAREVRPQPIDLADLASEAFDRFQPLALEKRLELDLETQSAPVHADPRLLEQALNNLVSNALRYTSKGRVVVKSGLEAKKAFLEVSEHAMGFKATEGLGLRVARTVAEAHAGSLEFNFNHGTTARLVLPAS
ncbi:MAG: HAMP domain-containing histidine kinase [Deinococcus sp.]|nr:HAMP domain-containing histidine kinase [Deinococcus sp.]